jgi:hypothetical protein
MNFFDIKNLAPTAQSAREFIEEHEDLKGYLTIEAKFSFSLHSGDMKALWEVYHAGNTSQSSIFVQAAHLDDALKELVRRREIEKRMAPLSLPRIADTIADESPTDSGTPF